MGKKLAILSIFSLSFIYKSSVDSIEKQHTFLLKYEVRKKYAVFPSEWQMSEVIDRLFVFGKNVLYRYIQSPYSMEICRIRCQLKQRKKLKIRIVN